MAERAPNDVTRWLVSVVMVLGIAAASAVVRYWPPALSHPPLPPLVSNLAEAAPLRVEWPADRGIVVVVLSKPRREAPIPIGASRFPVANLLSLVSVGDDRNEPGEALAASGAPMPVWTTLPGTSFEMTALTAPSVTQASVSGGTSDAPLADPSPGAGAVVRAFVSAGRGIAVGMRAAGAGIRAAF